MKHPESKGAALIVAIILLLVVTLLATTGMMLSTTEMAMAGNEQVHRQAVDAASAGVEAAIANLAAMPVDRGNAFTLADAIGAGGYVASARYAGEETSLPGFSVGGFSGLHFEIESAGRAARNAGDAQLQGVMMLRSNGAVETFVKRGAGLADAGGAP